MAVRTDLAELAALGDFFDLTRPASAGALTVLNLAEQSDAIAQEIDRTTAALCERDELSSEQIERRAAASLVHLGLVARIVAPVVGAASLSDQAMLGVGALRVHRLGDGRLVLSASSVDGADDLLEVLRSLDAGFARAAALSSIVMWGNVGSAVASAAAMVVRGRPDRADAARAAAAQLFTTGELAGTGAYVDGAWRRTSCCLYYRIPGGGLCGDCVLSLDRGVGAM